MDNTQRPSTSSGDVIASEEILNNSGAAGAEAQCFKVMFGAKGRDEQKEIAPTRSKREVVLWAQVLQEYKKRRAMLMAWDDRITANPGCMLPRARGTAPPPNRNTIPGLLGGTLKRWFGNTATASQWNDDGGENKHAVQATANRRPTPSTTPGGFTSMVFGDTGAGDFASIFSGPAVNDVNYTCMLLAVCVKCGADPDGTNNSGGPTVMSLHFTQPTNERFTMYITTADGHIHCDWLGGTPNTESNASICDSQWHTIIFRGDGTGGKLLELWVDGTLQTDTATGGDANKINLFQMTSALNHLGIGDYDVTVTTAPIVGELASPIIALSNTPHTNADVAALHTILSRFINGGWQTYGLGL